MASSTPSLLAFDSKLNKFFHSNDPSLSAGQRETLREACGFSSLDERRHALDIIVNHPNTIELSLRVKAMLELNNISAMEPSKKRRVAADSSQRLLLELNARNDFKWTDFKADFKDFLHSEQAHQKEQSQQSQPFQSQGEGVSSQSEEESLLPAPPSSASVPDSFLDHVKNCATAASSSLTSADFFFMSSEHCYRQFLTVDFFATALDDSARCALIDGVIAQQTTSHATASLFCQALLVPWIMSPASESFLSSRSLIGALLQASQSQPRALLHSLCLPLLREIPEHAASSQLALLRSLLQQAPLNFTTECLTSYFSASADPLFYTDLLQELCQQDPCRLPESIIDAIAKTMSSAKQLALNHCSLIFHPFLLALSRLKKRLACPWNLSIVDYTDATGNCQFDSAADQLHKYDEFQGITHEQVRERVVSWLRNNASYRLGNDNDSETLESWVKATQGLEWPAYCEKMSKLGVWGDELTMKAITEVFQCRIFLWSSTVSEENYFSEHLPSSVSEVGEQEAAVNDKVAAEPPLFESTLLQTNVASTSSPTAQVKRTLLLCHVLEVHYGSVHLNSEKSGATGSSPEAPSSSTAASSSPSLPPSSLSQEHQRTLLHTLFAPSPSLSASVIDFVANVQANHLSLAVNTLIDLSKKGVAASSSNDGTLPAATSHQQSSTHDEHRLTDSEEILKDFHLVDKTEFSSNESASISVAKVHFGQEERSSLAVYFEAKDASVARASDWLALAPCSAKPAEYYRYWKTGGTHQGLLNFSVPVELWGRFEFRWMRESLAILTRSESFLLGPQISMSIEWSPQEPHKKTTQHDLLNGRPFTVFVENSGDQCWSSYDWIGLYPTDESSNSRYLQSVYVHEKRAQLHMPSLNSFELRFFSGYKKYHALSALAVFVRNENELIGVEIKKN